MIAHIVDGLRRREIRVRVESGRLAVSPASRLTEADRETIVRNKAALFAYLSDTSDEWDVSEAGLLTAAADELVEALGVSGTEPAVWAAAGRVTAAWATRDMAVLREQVADFERVVRAVADRRAVTPP